MAIRNILTVCIGNICRSPMAEGLMATALPAVHVASAGLSAMTGRPADPIACELMRERSIDITAHRARQLSLEMCQQADLILVMDHAQRQAVTQRYPLTNGKVYRLCEAAGKEVPDPYGGPRSEFQVSFALIEDGATQWIHRISRIASR